MEKLRDRYDRYKEWKLQPHQVAPLSEEQHECATCGTRYEGNYCPRCGQSAKITRYSFKNAFLLFVDVWGLGNRGMFRSIRDLLFRPGYMIRDYLRGMQMAYFPPFKLFFLLLTLSLLIDSGMNIEGVNRNGGDYVKVETTVDENVNQAEGQVAETMPATDEERKAQKKKEFLYKLETGEVLALVIKWYYQHISLVWLVSLLIFTVPLYLLFRHSPAIPDLRFSECFVSMIYITDMLIIYSLVPSFLCFDDLTNMVFFMFCQLLMVIPIKQLSGYSYWSTIWRMVVAAIPFFIIAISLFCAIKFAWGYVYINY